MTFFTVVILLDEPVNIKAFRWLDSAIIHSNLGFFSFVCFFEGGWGSTKRIYTFVGGVRNFGGNFFKYPPPIVDTL